ncbi:hypothetical protein ACFL6U_04480 [Planctomycetota bacterium]
MMEQTVDPMQRTQSHLKVLGILFILFGILGLVGLVGIAVQRWMGQHIMQLDPFLEIPPEQRDMIAGLMRALILALILLSLIHVFFNALVGVCLMRQKYYWPCYIAVIFTCLAFPLGTALGIYGLVVLSRPEARLLFGLSEPVNATY